MRTLLLRTMASAPASRISSTASSIMSEVTFSSGSSMVILIPGPWTGTVPANTFIRVSRSSASC